MAVPTVTIGNPTKKSDYDDLVDWVHANKLDRDGQVPAMGVMQWDKGADVASAGTLALGNDGNYFDITGTTGITAISQQDVGAVNVQAGTVVRLHFNGACPITHNATSLPLPGKANITTAAGDELEFICLDATNQYWRCTNYSPANGIDHDALLNFVANEHLLPAAIDHDALLNFVANEHLLPAAIDHNALLNFVAGQHVPVIDEDNMISNSAVHVPTQQSVKAYVDTEVSKAMYTTSVLKVYPNSAAPIAAVSSATAWAFGAYVEVVPVNTITSAFVIIGVKITRDLAATGEWQIRIASGAAASEVVKLNFAGDSEDDTNAGSIASTPIPGLFSANDRISVGVSDEEAAARTYRVKILYYELPL